MRRHPKASRRATSVRRRRGRLGRNTTRLGLALAGALILALAVGATLAAAVAPTVTIDNATSVSYTSAHASGKVDPQGQSTTYRFQYLSDTQLQENIGNGFPEWEFAQTAKEESIEGAEQAVDADLTGLAPGTTFHLRLLAENADGSSEAVAGATFTTEAVGQPALTLAAPTGVNGSAAHFSGTVNPEAPAGNPAAFDVTWQFELSADGGGSWSPVGVGGTIPADATGHTVEADATGLNPGQAYEVRLAATNAAGTVTAGPEGFTEPVVGPSILSTSANPSQHEVTFYGTINPNGAATTYHFDYGATSGYGLSTPSQAIPAGNAPVQVNQTALGLAPVTGYHYRLVVGNSAGGGESGDRTFTTLSATAPPESCPNAAIRQEQGSTWLPECRAFEIVNPPGLDAGEVTRSPATANDGEIVAWQSPILPEGALGGNVVYTAAAHRGASGWSSVDSNALQPELAHAEAIWAVSGFSENFSRELKTTSISYDPNDPFHTDDLYRINVGTGATTWVTSGPAESFKTFVGFNPAMSRVVYEVQAPGQVFEVWVWDEHTGLERVSILPNGQPAPSRTLTTLTQLPHGGIHPISTDATKIFFVSGSAFGGALYVRDTTTQTTVLVSGSERTGEVGEPKEVTFLGASPSGDIAYFESGVAMTNAPAPEGGIYRWDRSTGKLTLVAAVGSIETSLPSNDASHMYFATHQALASGGTEGMLNLYVWSGGVPKFIASLEGSGTFTRSSLDGGYALFQTSAQIDGSSNAGHEAIFEYDAATGVISCASCRPDGSPSEGDASLTAQPFSTAGRTTQRNISNSGQVFFTSTDRIVPADKTTARDVYEYDAGTVSLLSPGQGDTSSFVADNSDDGRNVFILSRSPLVPEDKDSSDLDMYDVRVDGGFPSHAAAPPVNCNGEGCQGEATAPPASPSTASQGVAGVGNFKAKPKKHKKHHKKKHHKKHGKQKGKKSRNAKSNGRTGK